MLLSKISVSLRWKIATLSNYVYLRSSDTESDRSFSISLCLFYYPNGAINFCFRFIVFYYFFCFFCTSRIPDMFMFCERYFFNRFIMLYFPRVYHFRRCSSFLFLLVKILEWLRFLCVCSRGLLFVVTGSFIRWMLIGSDERGIILIIMSSICIPTKSMLLPSNNFISKTKIDKEIEREEYNTLNK